MRARKVYIGRTWPIWPNAVRVSVGTPEDMAAFKAAFAEVMASKPIAELPGGPAELAVAELPGFPHFS